MKNLGNNHRGKFEEVWEDVFQDKEMHSNPRVWEKIDAHLTSQELKKYKKGIFLHKWVAAASVIIAAGVISFFYFNTIRNISSEEELISKKETTETNLIDTISQQYDINITDYTDHTGDENGTEIADVTDKNKKLVKDNQEESINENVTFQQNEVAISKDNGSRVVVNGQHNTSNKGKTMAQKVPVDKSTIPEESHLSNDLRSESLIALLETKKSDLDFLDSQPSNIFIDKVIIFSEDPFREEKEKTRENLWAGINFSGGLFNPNVGDSHNGESLLASDNSLNQYYSADSRSNSIREDVNSGKSVSFGFDIGKKISKKWMVQSGINYKNHTSRAKTNAFFNTSNNTKTLLFSSVDNSTRNDIVGLDVSADVDLDNNFEFISLPLKAGYLLIDKKVSLILSTGVATEFLIKNTITSEDNSNIENVTIKPGSSSPYKNVYFNGLIGTQVRYNFLKNYSLTIEPQYAIAISSFSKRDSNLSSNPSLFSVALGMKYNF